MAGNLQEFVELENSLLHDADTKNRQRAHDFDAYEKGTALGQAATSFAQGEYSHSRTLEGSGGYGRTLAEFVNVEGESIGPGIVRNGLAAPYNARTDYEYRQALENPINTETERDQAYSELALRLKDRKKTYEFNEAPVFGDELADHVKSKRTMKDRALERGWENLKGSFNTFGSVLAGAVGADETSDSLMQDALNNMAESGLVPANMARIEDINSAGDVLTFALERLVEEAPSLAIDLAATATGAGAGAVVARRAAMKAIAKKYGDEAAEELVSRVKASATTAGAKRGATAAFVGSTYPQSVAQAEQELQAAGVEGNDWATLATGGVIAGVQVLPEILMAKRLLDKAGAGKDMASIVGSAKEIAGTTATTALTEAAAEAGASTIAKAAVKAYDQSYEIFSEENLLDIANSAAAGAVVGGAIGGASSTVAAAYSGADELYQRKKAEIATEIEAGKQAEQEAAAQQSQADVNAQQLAQQEMPEPERPHNPGVDYITDNARTMRSDSPAYPTDVQITSYGGQPINSLGEFAAQEDAVDGQAAPNVEQAAPNVEQVAPNVEQVAPNVEQAAPNVEQVAPNVEQVAPNVEQVAPNVEQAASVTLAEFAETPAADEAAPVVTAEQAAPEEIQEAEAFAQKATRKYGLGLIGASIEYRKSGKDVYDRLARHLKAAGVEVETDFDPFSDSFSELLESMAATAKAHQPKFEDENDPRRQDLMTPTEIKRLMREASIKPLKKGKALAPLIDTVAGWIDSIQMADPDLKSRYAALRRQFPKVMGDDAKSGLTALAAHIRKTGAELNDAQGEALEAMANKLFISTVEYREQNKLAKARVAPIESGKTLAAQGAKAIDTRVTPQVGPLEAKVKAKRKRANRVNDKKVDRELSRTARVKKLFDEANDLVKQQLGRLVIADRTGDYEAVNTFINKEGDVDIQTGSVGGMYIVGDESRGEIADISYTPSFDLPERDFQSRLEDVRLAYQAGKIGNETVEFIDRYLTATGYGNRVSGYPVEMRVVTAMNRMVSDITAGMPDAEVQDRSVSATATVTAFNVLKWYAALYTGGKPSKQLVGIAKALQKRTISYLNSLGVTDIPPQLQDIVDIAITTTKINRDGHKDDNGKTPLELYHPKDVDGLNFAQSRAAISYDLPTFKEIADTPELVEALNAKDFDAFVDVLIRGEIIPLDNEFGRFIRDSVDYNAVNRNVRVLQHTYNVKDPLTPLFYPAANVRSREASDIGLVVKSGDSETSRTVKNADRKKPAFTPPVDESIEVRAYVTAPQSDANPDGAGIRDGYFHIPGYVQDMLTNTADPVTPIFVQVFNIINDAHVSLNTIDPRVLAATVHTAPSIPDTKIVYRDPDSGRVYKWGEIRKLAADYQNRASWMVAGEGRSQFEPQNEKVESMAALEDVLVELHSKLVNADGSLTAMGEKTALAMGGFNRDKLPTQRTNLKRMLVNLARLVYGKDDRHIDVADDQVSAWEYAARQSGMLQTFTGKRNENGLQAFIKREDKARAEEAADRIRAKKELDGNFRNFTKTSEIFNIDHASAVLDYLQDQFGSEFSPNSLSIDFITDTSKKITDARSILSELDYLDNESSQSTQNDNFVMTDIETRKELDERGEEVTKAEAPESLARLKRAKDSRLPFTQVGPYQRKLTRMTWQSLARELRLARAAYLRAYQNTGDSKVLKNAVDKMRSLVERAKSDLETSSRSTDSMITAVQGLKERANTVDDAVGKTPSTQNELRDALTELSAQLDKYVTGQRLKSEQQATLDFAAQRNERVTFIEALDAAIAKALEYKTLPDEQKVKKPLKKVAEVYAMGDMPLNALRHRVRALMNNLSSRYSSQYLGIDEGKNKRYVSPAEQAKELGQKPMREKMATDFDAQDVVNHAVQVMLGAIKGGSEFSFQLNFGHPKTNITRVDDKELIINLPEVYKDPQAITTAIYAAAHELAHLVVSDDLFLPAADQKIVFQEYTRFIEANRTGPGSRFDDGRYDVKEFLADQVGAYLVGTLKDSQRAVVAADNSKFNQILRRLADAIIRVYEVTTETLKSLFPGRAMAITSPSMENIALSLVNSDINLPIGVTEFFNGRPKNALIAVRKHAPKLIENRFANFFKPIGRRLQNIDRELGRLFYTPPGDKKAGQSAGLMDEVIHRRKEFTTYIDRHYKKHSELKADYKRFLDTGKASDALTAVFKHMADALAKVRPADKYSFKGVPIMFSERDVRERGAELRKILTGGDSSKAWAKVVDEFITSFDYGTREVSDVNMRPGNPFGKSDLFGTIRENRPDLIPQLRKAGFIMDSEVELLNQLTGGMAMRVEFERLFGAMDVDGQGNKFWNPSKKLADRLTAITDDGQRKEAIRAIHSMLGFDAQKVHPAWRTFNDWAVSLTSLAVLPLSGFASVPDLIMPFVRTRSWSGAFGGMMRVLAMTATNPKMVGEILRSLSLASSAIHDTVWSQMASDNALLSRAPKTISNVLFKLNGLELITKVSRNVAAVLVVDMIKQHAARGTPESNRFLASIGLTTDQARSIATYLRENGIIPTFDPTKDDAHNAMAEGLSRAATIFTNESLVHPNRAQLPAVMNDPNYRVFTLLKPFLYGFGSVVYGGSYREMRTRFMNHKNLGHALLDSPTVASPLILAFGLMMPMAAAGLELREWLRDMLAGDDKYSDRLDALSEKDYVMKIFARAGGAAFFEIPMQAYEGWEWGRGDYATGALNAVLRLAGPVATVPVQAGLDAMNENRDGIRIGVWDIEAIKNRLSL